MRYGVLSDVHGNAPALRAVLDDAGRRGVDGYLNLGDIFYGPLWPAETFALLEPLAALTIRGNQDRELYEATAAELEASPTLRHCVEALGAGGLEWLRNLPAGQHLEIGGVPALLTHGIPGDDTVYLLEDIAHGEPRVREDEAIASLLSGAKESLVLCGHSHVPRCVALASGQLIVNPGSVGLPAYDDALPVFHRMQSCSPMAAYAVLEIEAGRVSVNLLRVPYDHAAAARRAEALGRADWARWLRTGRA